MTDIPPLLCQSPTDPAFVQDPYAFYDRARAAGPFFRWDAYDMICATSHGAVATILRDRRFGRESPPDRRAPVPDHTAPFQRIEDHSMLELEPPRHTRLRGLVLRAFTSRRIAGMEDEIAAICDRLIDRFPGGSFDLLDAYARHVPVIVICRLLGVPEEAGDDLLAWSNAMVAMYQARRTRRIEDDAARASEAFAAFLRDWIAQKRARPGDDLISTLIAAEGEDGKLSEDELISTCILLLNAGHEATVHTIGNGVAVLDREGRRDVDAAVVEEILRFDPPLHMFTRWAYEEVEIAGHVFAPGDEVACLLAAANRDPAVYDAPDRFAPDRDGPANVAFGGGIHFCVGAPLARLELLVALRTLYARCPDLRVTAQPRYGDIYHFHGLEALSVEV